jgi:hypothetical protein
MASRQLSRNDQVSRQSQAKNPLENWSEAVVRAYEMIFGWRGVSPL